MEGYNTNILEPLRPVIKAIHIIWYEAILYDIARVDVFRAIKAT